MQHLLDFQRPKGDILISIDDDLQYHPEDIKLLLDQMGNNYDVVYGIPKKTNQSFYRSIGSNFVNYVYRRLFHRNHNRSSFAAIRKTIVKSRLNHEESLHFIDGLVLWYTDKISTVEISQSPRKHGSSRWKLKSLIRATMDMITNYSRTPLLLSK